jgi:3-dehydroquinate synthase
LDTVDFSIKNIGILRDATGTYRVFVGTRLLRRIGGLLRRHVDRKTCAIITDSNVARHFADTVEKSVLEVGLCPTLITISAGEKSKTLEQAGVICDRMVAAGLDRQSFVVGLGGGMIGDISGFVAAVYHRGIPHIQIPTTLLAMVDSSIGGKTGVDTRAGKNLIGAFHQPSLVVADVDVLKTLARREFNQGFAEIIKHAVIADAKMFRRLQSLNAGDAPALQSLIKRNIAIKLQIVAKDERDRTGERAVLNFGHTIGHAIERAGNYSKFLHGEAVSLGIVAACSISVTKAGLRTEHRDAIVSLLEGLGLPTRLPSKFPRKKILDAVKLDKKFEDGKMRFVVTPRIGVGYVADNITLDDIQEAVAAL